MMHDATLNRTTTGTGKTTECNWEGYIDGLTTKTDPPQPIPRFKEVVNLMLRQDVIDRNMYMIVDIKVSWRERERAHAAIGKKYVPYFFCVWPMR